MFTQSAELYDLIYGEFKDYAGETERVAALLARVHPGARRLLDVGCGTGEHAWRLAARGYRVDGLDVEGEFVRIARAKHPDGSFHVADMTDFRLPGRYHVVLCLFSAIGYVQTLENLRRALDCFRAHLEPGGVLVLEPWFAPGEWQPGNVYLHTVERDGVKVCRMSHSSARERISILDFHYLVGTNAGIEHRREVHRLGLFTADEQRACLLQAGFTGVDHDREGLTGRGLFIARAGS